MKYPLCKIDEVPDEGTKLISANDAKQDFRHGSVAFRYVIEFFRPALFSVLSPNIGGQNGHCSPSIQRR